MMQLNSCFLICVVLALAFLSIIRLRQLGTMSYKIVQRDELALVRFILSLFVIIGHCDIEMPGSPLLETFHLGTVAVSIFFFVSGAGLVKCYDHYGLDYVRKIPVNAAVKLCVPLSTATFLWALALILSDVRADYGVPLIPSSSGETFLPASWYVYVQYLFYIFFYFVFRFVGKSRGGIALLLLCGAYYVSMRHFSSWHARWSWASLSFPLGVLYSQNEETFCRFLKTRMRWAPILTMVGLFLLTFLGNRLLGWRIFFDLRLWLLGPIAYFSLAVLPHTKSGAWLGGISFEVYLLHCIPEAILLSYFKGESAVFYCLVVVACSIALASIVHPIDIWLIRRVKVLLNKGGMMNE